MDLRALTEDDCHHLRSFACASRHAGASIEAQHLIRTEVPTLIEAGRVTAIGAWRDETLVAVIAYTVHGTLWRVMVLATDVRYQRRKQAFRLKREVMAIARQAGAAALISQVHRDNGPMLALNRKLGCVVDVPDNDDNPYLVCTIPL